jgi:hypothetical protein
MHPLHVLKHAALNALETEDGPGDVANFHSIVDPQSVLELVEFAEARLTDEEVNSLQQVITELSEFIRRTAPTPEAMKLLLRARMVVGVTSR